MVHKLLVESIWTSTRRHLLSACVIAVTGLCAGTASASTINVNTTGLSSPTRCNLTDAIRAATTNTRVNGCAAGQPAPTIDTIQLQAGNGTTVIYTGYGTSIWFPAAPNDGGPIVLAGGSSSPSRTAIIAPDYGAPNSEAALCGSAAIYSGGSNVTIRGLTVAAAGSGSPATGICNYSGDLTIDNVIVGPTGENNTSGFVESAIWAWGAAGQHNLNINAADISYNSSGGIGAGASTLGLGVTTTITNSDFENNTAPQGLPGAIWWGGGGDLTISGTTFNDNQTAGSSGGALDLYCDPSTCSGQVVLSNDVFTNNASFPGDGAGTINVNTAGGNFPLTISGATDVDDSNWTAPDFQHSSFMPNWQTFFSVYCTDYSYIANVSGSEWAEYAAEVGNGPFASDGTCQFN